LHVVLGDDIDVTFVFYLDHAPAAGAQYLSGFAGDSFGQDQCVIQRVTPLAGGVSRDEMDRVFNMGVGMLAVIRPEHVDAFTAHVASTGLEQWVVGTVQPGEGVRYV